MCLETSVHFFGVSLLWCFVGCFFMCKVRLTTEHDHFSLSSGEEFSPIIAEHDYDPGETQKDNQIA